MKQQKLRVTRADVARQAGVSETVVSYVLNKNRYVDADKLRRVEAAVRELNYRPNNAARALKGKQTNHIVFIADRLETEHFSKLVAEMDLYAYDRGYMISLCQNRNTPEFISQIISRQYDGIIISSISFPEEYICRLIDARIPVVLLCNREYHEVKGAATIDTGLFGGARECVRHLVERGRRHVVYLDRISERGHFSNMDDLRLRGFIEEMNEFNCKVTEHSFITGARSEVECVSLLSSRLTRNDILCDAVFARNDLLACIAMQTINNLGMTVPNDIAVIGFDNSSLSRYTVPTLSTVEIKQREIGRTAIEMLHRMIHEDRIPEPQAFNTELIVRGST